MFSLGGKSYVVTGASRGLGRAIALAFAGQGADVVLAARSVPDLEALRAEIEGKGRRAVAAPSDVAAAAVDFASAEAEWVSGAVLLVSGGAVVTSDPYRYLMRVNRDL
jgi:NAD(P)-dependent dehydrogenase (short-subunit alcohol dehydrogenase family)